MQGSPPITCKRITLTKDQDEFIMRMNTQWKTAMASTNRPIPLCDTSLLVQWDPANVTATYATTTQAQTDLWDALVALSLPTVGKRFLPTTEGQPVTAMFDGVTMAQIQEAATKHQASTTTADVARRERLQVLFADPATTIVLRRTREEFMEELLAWSSANGTGNPNGFTVDGRNLFAGVQALAADRYATFWDDSLLGWCRTAPPPF
eukprot:TRINITY_DN32931_c0_g1_i1.p1 TRINITY_DN32931_c0_g1~~TRINITY_DN32931_c0_g1_i1.p1  ORF type:complete len:207 (-),score=12.36 TRINITY_DN32931_c0_g1_i1:152-772(-)